MESSGFDLQAAHRHFATDCFNRAWDLIRQDERTREECEEMIRLSETSCWHWSQREDCTERHLAAARALAAEIEDAEERGMLEKDLVAIGGVS